jgi:hypothetical protein
MQHRLPVNRLLEQTEYRLWQLVCLCQDGRARLLHDLVLTQCSCFGSKVSILNPSSRCGHIFLNILQVCDGVLKPVLDGTQVSTLGVNFLDGGVNDNQGFLRTLSHW